MSVLFDITKIEGLELWLDANDRDTIVYNGANISNWYDKSTNENHATQTNSIYQPTISTLNNKNIINFNADYFDLTNEISKTKCAFFVTNNMDGSDFLATASSVFGYDSDDYTFINVNTTDGNYDISIDGSLARTGNANVNGENLVSGGNIDLGQTNAENESSNVWYCDFDSDVIRTTKIARFQIGVNVYRLKGEIAEILIFNEVLTTSDRQKVEGYLAYKWGLDSKLDAGHPYKSEFVGIWQTPITDWDGTTVNRTYYNFGDLDRVEQNTEYLDDEFELIGYLSSTTTFTYQRTNAIIDFKGSINRVESNIKAIKDATYTPLIWETPKTDWVSVTNFFGYTEANRLEKNCLGLYTMLNNIIDSYIPTGHPSAVCGKGNVRF